jgi:hypothetical protein
VVGSGLAANVAGRVALDTATATAKLTDLIKRKHCRPAVVMAWPDRS